MSDRTAKRLPSRIRPIAIPAVGRFKGTPASISASEAPQTEAIDDEPFDSVISETTRTVYGNSWCGGSTGWIARQASLPWPISRRLVPPRRPVSPAGVGGEVVVQQERLFIRSRQRVDVLLVLAGAERGHDHRLGLAAGEQRRAVGTWQDAGFGDDVADGLDVAAVDALAGVENVPADDLGFELLEHTGDAELVVFGLLAFGEEVRHRLFLDGADGGITLLLDRDGVGLAQILFDQAEHFLLDGGIVDHGDFARLLGRLFREFDDRLDHGLEVAVAEHHGAQ